MRLGTNRAKGTFIDLLIKLSLQTFIEAIDQGSLIHSTGNEKGNVLHAHKNQQIRNMYYLVDSRLGLHCNTVQYNTIRNVA